MIIKQSTGTRSALVTGACVNANGQKATSGAVDAMRITITAPVKGSCATGFVGGHGPGIGGYAGGPPRIPTGSTGAAGAGPPAGGFPGFGNFGFASGSITAVDGST